MKRILALAWAALAVASAWLASPGPAAAHPHVFVDCSLTFVFDDDGLAGFQQRWVLDEMFAAMILQEHDANGDKRIQPGESASIKTGAFDNLKNFNYFNLVEIDGEIFEPEWVKDFSASMDGGKLVYEFFLPCHVAASKSEKTVRVAVRDPNYYADVIFAAGTPALKNAEGLQVALDLVEVPSWAYYGGQIVPEAAVCTFRRIP